ncbi:hypothetical protein BDR26DRAFT_652645 [Obelidium mucronatum]|nr:hypothetical protein BDR26DRAFT_652645 [Obelidium mucronatum]
MMTGKSMNGQSSVQYLLLPPVRQDVKEFYEPKLDGHDGFILKLRYTDHITKCEKVADLNKKLLEKYIGCQDTTGTMILIDKNQPGFAPLNNTGHKKLVINEGNSTVVVRVDPATIHSFSDVKSLVSATSDVNLSDDSTVVSSCGGSYSVSTLPFAMSMSNADGDEHLEVHVPVASISETESIAPSEPLNVVPCTEQKEFDVMVSYCWKSSKDLVDTVVYALRAEGLTVWFDESEMHNNILDRMAEAICKSKVFCMFLNVEYQESYNCQLEYGFAAAKKKPVVIARDTTGDLKDDGAALLAGCNLYSDFSGPDFDTPFQLLYMNIRNAIATSTANHSAVAIAEAQQQQQQQQQPESGELLRDWLNPVDFTDDLTRFQEAYVPPTRQWMLKSLREWMSQETQSVLVLFGGAGVGKSVFAWLAQHNPDTYIAPASFFCRHNNERKNNAKNVLSTLAFQLAEYSQEFAAYLYEVQWNETALQEANSDIIPLVQRADAFETLILDGLAYIQVPEGKNLLLVVDALDECETPGSLGRANLLSTIKENYKKLPKGIKLLVTSRPEEDIVSALESIHPDQMLVREQQSIDDVLLYLNVKLAKICEDAGVPYEKEVRDAAALLADASQGVFVFAALACKSLAEMDNTWCDGGDMDGIYTPFLQSHYVDATTQDIAMFKACMGVVTALSIGLSSESIALILKVPVFSVDAVVLRIRSILHVEGGKIRVLHKSVKDFLTSARCTDLRFRIGLSAPHDLICRQCFDLVLLSPETPAPSELYRYTIAYWTHHLANGSIGNLDDHLPLLERLLENQGACLITWFKALLQTNTPATTTAKNNIFSYLAKVKKSESLKPTAEKCEKALNVAFLVFGEVYKEVLWEGQVATFQDVLKELKVEEQLAKAEVAELSEYDFYVSFELGSADAAKQLSDGLRKAGHTVALMSHAKESAELLKDQSRILQSTVFLVLLTAKYEDSRQCRANFDYAKSNDRGMFGMFLDPESVVRGDASWYLENSFWTTDTLSSGKVKNVLALYKIKAELKFDTWKRFCACIGDGMSTIRAMSLVGYKLAGSVPKELSGLTQLTALSLARNRLIGSIPSELCSLTQLAHLNLSDNQLTGEIPGSIGELVQLKILDLSFNQLSGMIPNEFGCLVALTSLDLNGNKLDGEIPVEIGQLSELTVLNLAKNELTGTIPKEVGNLAVLTRL